MLRTTYHSTSLYGFSRSFRLYLQQLYKHPTRARDDDSITSTDSERTDSNKTSDTSSESEGEGQMPEEPTTCCMSGCANCVWLEYVEKMNEYFKNGEEQAIKEIEEKVQDPNMKAFLLSELRIRSKKKK